MQSNTQRLRDLQDSRETGIAVFAERLVKALSTEAGAVIEMVGMIVGSAHGILLDMRQLPFDPG